MNNTYIKARASKSDIISEAAITNITEIPNRSYNDLQDKPDFEKYIVAAVIRYYSSIDSWALISEQEGFHTTIGVSSVTSSSFGITINYDKTGWPEGTYPSTFVAVPDEQLAKEGLIIGSSVGVDSAELQCYKAGAAQHFIYNTQFSYTLLGGGIGFNNALRQFNANSEYEVKIDPTQFLYKGLGGLPTVTGLDGKYTPKIVNYDVNTGVLRIKFYDSSGTLITTPDSNCEFYVQNPGVTTRVKVDGNNFPDKYGNIWIYGILK